MNRPPLFLSLAIGRRHGFRLWLPLFLLLPFLLVLLLLILPFLILGTLFFWMFGWGRSLLLFIPVLLGILWALRGLEVDVEDSNEKVFISIR